MTQRIKMIGSAMSQFLNMFTAFDLTETGPNESVSARMHRQGHKRRERLINAIFRDPDHCKNAHMNDVRDAYALIAEYEDRIK